MRKKGTIDLEVVVLVAAFVIFMVTLLMIYVMNAQVTQLEKTVQLMGKNLDGLKTQVQSLQAQLQQLIKYSPLFNG